MNDRYDMSKPRMERGVVWLCVVWGLCAALVIGAMVLACTGCRSKPTEPPVDLDHWDHQGEVIL
jgi:hypothetical protein